MTAGIGKPLHPSASNQRCAAGLRITKVSRIDLHRSLYGRAHHVLSMLHACISSGTTAKMCLPAS